LQDGIIDQVLLNNDNNDNKNNPPKSKQQQKQQQPAAPLCGDDFVSLNYWRRTKDGRILFGSLADAYPIPSWLAEYRLRYSLRQIYPQLGDMPFDHVWSGRLAVAIDAVPLIGRDQGYDQFDSSTNNNNNNKDLLKPSDGGVWYATGFGGHGIVPTAMAGSVLADAILGIDDNTWRLFQREFPPKYSFWPVSRIGAQATLMTYSIFDWLHVKGVPVPRLPKPW
jgi:glycine/D-amino acid oxidase-like deaminating enzyme